MNPPPKPSTGKAVDPENVAAASRRCPPLPNFFDPKSPVAYLKGDLPHWRQDGATYFVTFRLADSLPQEKLDQWLREREDWLMKHPEPHDEAAVAEYYELFPKRFQAWLDNGHGSCVLELPEIKQLVEAALRHFDGQRYRLDEHVVMPNHVHALVTPTGENTLSEILHSWKSFTAHKILRLEAATRWLKKFTLKNRGVFRVLHVWQKESFDHIIRSPEQLGRIREYIRENPSARGKTVDRQRDSGGTPLLRLGATHAFRSRRHPTYCNAPVQLLPQPAVQARQCWPV